MNIVKVNKARFTHIPESCFLDFDLFICLKISKNEFPLISPYKSDNMET